MPIPVKIELPEWSFNVAWKISELRASHFKNRFQNKKIRSFHRGKKYYEHIESIIGYLGDIACAIFLGIDPKKMIVDMVYSTNCLKHRDEYDLVYNGLRIDVKMEDYGKFQNKVLNNTIKNNELYGHRLINKTQWEENSKKIDIYVFGTFEKPFSYFYKLDQVKSVYLIGFVEKSEIETMEFSNITPAGGKLHTPAKIIPHDKLIDINKLKDLKKQENSSKQSYLPNEDPDCENIINILEKIWL
jgi:hypothetical protein